MPTVCLLPYQHHTLYASRADQLQSLHLPQAILQHLLERQTMPTRTYRQTAATSASLVEVTQHTSVTKKKEKTVVHTAYEIKMANVGNPHLKNRQR
jgi:hypothetical protein